MTSIRALLTRFDNWMFGGKTDGFLRVTGTGTPTQSVVINPLNAQVAMVAPYQVTLEANVTDFGVTAGGAGEWDPQYHDIEYIWSVEKVGDASYATSTYTAPVNVPAANRVKGTKYGKRIVHVIGRDDVSAGSSSTFRFTVTAVNLATGVSATSTAYERVIEHPDDYFSAAETFVVRPSGAETGFPTTTNNSGNPYTSWSAARTAAQAAVNASSISKVRICLQKGSTADPQRFLNPVSNPTGCTTYVVDTWGASGDKPTISARWEVWRDRNDACTTSAFYGLRVEGTTPGDDHWWLADNSTAAHTTTFDSVDSEGLNDAFGRPVGGSFANTWLCWFNCSGTGYTETAGSRGGKTWAMVACRYGQNIDESSDNKGGGGYGLRGPDGTELIYFSQCDGFLRAGWFNNVPGIQTSQNLTRVFGSGSTMRAGAYVHIERCAFEGGSVGVGEVNSVTTNTLIERNMVVAPHDVVQGLIGINTSGTIRNNLLIKPPSRNAQNSSSFNVQQFIFQERIGSDADVLTAPSKVYNNTCIFLPNDHTPVAYAQNTGAGTFSTIEANNVLHAPFAPSPVNAGSFTLSEQFTPRYKGYTERDHTGVGDPQYRVLVASATGSHSAGNTLTGRTSGFTKTLRVIESPGDWFQSSGTGYRFDASVIFARIDEAAGFERFTGGEILDNNDTGGTLTLAAANGAYLGQPFDTGWDLIGFLPQTATPTHYIDYDAESAAFTEGNTLTNGTATATICQVWDDGATGRLWLRDITGGTFSDNDSLTESDGSGAATANGGQQSAGTGALWGLDSNTARDGATWSTDPWTRKDFLGADTTLRGALAS